MQFNATSESLAQRGMELLVQAPFWAALFIRVNRRVEEHRAAALQLVWVDGAPAIEVAPRHWAALKESEQLLAIQHELIHLLLGHPAPRTLYGAPFLYDVAADLVVAQFLPEGVKFELDLDAAATDLDGLYQALIIAWEQESQDLLALFDRRATLFASHESWSSFTEPTLLQAYRKQVAVELYRHHGPGLLQEIPEAMTTALQPLLQSEVTPVDWRKALHFFSNSARRTQWAATIKRPSKRYGTTPGYRVRNKARLLVALDTSASISEADLSRFFKELQVLWRQGLELEVVECDQAIRRHYRYRGQLPDRVQGRGGTAFYPIFNYVAERQHFDGIIYFTDGKGVHPGKVPKIPLLWVLSPSGIAAQRLEEQQFPGRFIQMNN